MSGVTGVVSNGPGVNRNSQGTWPSFSTLIKVAFFSMAIIGADYHLHAVPACMKWKQGVDESRRYIEFHKGRRDEYRELYHRLKEEQCRKFSEPSPLYLTHDVTPFCMDTRDPWQVRRPIYRWGIEVDGEIEKAFDGARLAHNAVENAESLLKDKLAEDPSYCGKLVF